MLIPCKVSHADEGGGGGPGEEAKTLETDGNGEP
jgi:hypothetical protein